MVSEFSRFGTTTSLDLVKHGKGQHGSKRRQDFATNLYHPHISISTHNEQNTQPYAGFKRPRLNSQVAEDTIEASEICRTFIESISHPQISEYSQRQAARSTPSASLNPLLRLSHPSYGLPESLVQNFIAVGIESIYPWQSSCLLGRGILTGERNLVYSAPTGGGKSLVADVLMLKRVIEDPTKKAILVLPYVALVQEKLSWLRKIVAGVSKKDQHAEQPLISASTQVLKNAQNISLSSIRVAGFFGGTKAFRGAKWSDIDIAVCTFEKASWLVNDAIEKCTIDDLGIVVMDELHMIDDGSRGYLMELMASKLLSLHGSVQLIGMSATLSNTEQLSQWLNAKHYISKYKPIPIEEYWTVGDSIFPSSTSRDFLDLSTQINDSASEAVPLDETIKKFKSHVSSSRWVKKSEVKDLRNPVTNAVVSLAIETARSGYGALIFCSNRKGCETLALLISRAMPHGDDVAPGIMEQRRDVLSELRSLPIGIEDTLGKTVLKGVAFHHAGITLEERSIVAEAYDRGLLRVIVATCSLAAGINLPARRVIIQGAKMGRASIGPAMLRQMRGRAGRKGKDEVGETYLCCKEDDILEAAQLIQAELPVVASGLTPERRGIKRALLEVITVRLATHPIAIQEYIRRTLLFHTMDWNDLQHLVETATEQLIREGFVVIDDNGSYEATLLSKATVSSYMTPEDGLLLYDELQRAMRAFVMDGDMHIFYLFTPIQFHGIIDIDWQVFRREMENLDESGMRALKHVGVNPGLVIKMANSGKSLSEDTDEEVRRAGIYRRCYVAFQLRDLCNEIPIHTVAQRYNVSTGSVQTLSQVCEGFAAGVIQFCDRMGWGMLRSVLDHMSDRLKAGARADLLELAKIPFVKSRTARVLWDSGFRSLMAVAEADAKDILPILILAQPRKAKIYGQDDLKYHQKMMLKAEIIVGSANRLWNIQQQIEIEADI